jgi:hypothetical protein
LIEEEALIVVDDKVSLEALFHLPEGEGPFPGVVVCHPHPSYGGDIDNNVVAAIVRGVVEAGAAAIRFNFRGVSGSSGVHDNGNGEREDVLATLGVLRKDERIDERRVGLAGYSFGASMAIAAAPSSPTVLALALVAPPEASLATPEAKGYSCPKLLVVGDQDHVLPADRIQALTKEIPGPVEVQLLPGADHFLLGYEATVAERVRSFFAKALAG